jgi:putative endonuclease
MDYFVYIIQSQTTLKTYVGCTNSLAERLKKHNEGLAQYTKNKGPYDLIWYCCFKDKEKAYLFEKYLKSGSGRAFSLKHLLKSL